MSETEKISLRLPGGEFTSVNVFKGFKKAIGKVINQLTEETGIQLSRNEFIINATKYYLMYLSEAAEDREELINRMNVELTD